MSVVHWLQERQDLQWTSVQQFLRVFSFSISYSGTLWVHSVFSWWVIWKRLEAPIDWYQEPSPPILLVQCLFLILWEGPKPPRIVCDMGQGWTPRGWINVLWVHQERSFTTQGYKCRIQLLWHMTPGSHTILEYLYLFYNLIVYL